MGEVVSSKPTACNCKFPIYIYSWVHKIIKMVFIHMNEGPTITVMKKVDVNYLNRAWTKEEKKNHEMIYVFNIVV